MLRWSWKWSITCVHVRLGSVLPHRYQQCYQRSAINCAVNYPKCYQQCYHRSAINATNSQLSHSAVTQCYQLSRHAHQPLPTAHLASTTSQHNQLVPRGIQHIVGCPYQVAWREGRHPGDTHSRAWFTPD
jgi:hypothetical protein